MAQRTDIPRKFPVLSVNFAEAHLYIQVMLLSTITISIKTIAIGKDLPKPKIDCARNSLIPKGVVYGIILEWRLRNELSRLPARMGFRNWLLEDFAAVGKSGSFPTAFPTGFFNGI